MYAEREASLGWRVTITGLRDPLGQRVIDLGCGGGIYTRALAEMGAETVTAVDFSEAMLNRARQTTELLSNVEFIQAPADRVPLPDASADLIVARGLIHHLGDLTGFARETYRLLAPGGTLIVQDRTPDDISQPAGPENIRGYYFERFPELLQVDLARRHTSEQVHTALEKAGFVLSTDTTIDEVRAIHENPESFAESVRRRSGRSILHELDDTQLDELIDYILKRIPATGPIIDRDQWTLWVASKSGSS
jgi:ubiquinone/menaquinone biosynthesis C-methylase UbiE